MYELFLSPPSKGVEARGEAKRSTMSFRHTYRRLLRVPLLFFMFGLSPCRGWPLVSYICDISVVFIAFARRTEAITQDTQEDTHTATCTMEKSCAWRPFA